MERTLDRLTISLPRDLKKLAKAKAVMEEVTLSAVLSAWLQTWVEGNVDTPGEERTA
ncbi:MAG: hypothetical protein JXA37_14765 [Chloroflexia bacterium]|nr:hypothetical protein [Chloroflexia bacterium]